MVHNYITLLNDLTLCSSAAEGRRPSFPVHGNTYMYINIRTAGIVEHLQKLKTEPGQEVVFEGTNKIVEIISKMKPNSKGVFVLGTIFFEKEEEQVVPKLVLKTSFWEQVRERFNNPLMLVQGIVELENGSKTLESKRFTKSWSFKENHPMALTSPFPYEKVQPISTCHWTLRSFSLSIGWENGLKPNKSLKLNPNQVLTRLFVEGEDTPPKDFILVAGNGSKIPCHETILAAQGPGYAEMEQVNKRIKLNDCSQKTLEFFVGYIYCQDIPLEGMDCETALGLFHLGHHFRVPELMRGISKMMEEKKEVEWFSPNCLLELYFAIKNLKLDDFNKLGDHAVEIMLKLPKENLRQCERYQALNSKETSELILSLVLFKK